MFPPMRRKRQEMNSADTLELLHAGDYGILAVHGDDDYPYTIPINYVFLEEGLDGSAGKGALYFHCALDGHKIRAVHRNPKASFCVVEQHDVVPERFATTYRSVVAFGQLRIVSQDEMHDAVYKLTKKFDPKAHETILAEIEKDGPRCAVLELKVEHITGKRSSDLLKA